MLRDPIKKIRRPLRELDRRLVIAEQHHLERSLRDQGALEVQPRGVSPLREQNDHAPLRNRRQVARVGGHDHLRIDLHKRPHKLAQSRRLGSIDEQEDRPLAEPQAELQLVEPAGLRWTSFIMSSGCG